MDTRSATTFVTPSQLPAVELTYAPFFCLVNQLPSSTKHITEVLAPLLSTRNEFLWAQPHDEAFAQAKKALTSAPTLAYFDTTKKTRLYTDASTLGLGFVLLQKPADNSDEWKTVQARSDSLQIQQICRH